MKTPQIHGTELRIQNENATYAVKTSVRGSIYPIYIEIYAHSFNSSSWLNKKTKQNSMAPSFLTLNSVPTTILQILLHTEYSNPWPRQVPPFI